MYAKLACLGDEGVTLDPHDVPDVEEFLPNGVVHGLVLAGADLVPLDIDLDPSGGVLDLSERGGSHDPPGHYAACYADIREIALFGIESVGDGLCRRVDRVEGSRVWIDSKFL